MRILALEFSSPQRSVAVLTAGAGAESGRPIAEFENADSKPEIGGRPAKPVPPNLPVLGAKGTVSVSEVVETGRTNSMKPLGMVEEALRQAGIEREQIECLAVGLGPGSYTGIRAAIALAQGWQLAACAKLIGVSSVEAIAAEAHASGIRGRVSVVIDAQRNEFYLATYEVGAAGWREIEALRLANLEDVKSRADAGAILIGPEVGKWFSCGQVVFPRAAAVARLASGRTDYVSGEKLEPIYLREAKFVKAPPPRVIPPVDAQC